MERRIKRGFVVITMILIMGIQMSACVNAEETMNNSGTITDSLVFEGNCSYQTQIQNVGWQDWKSKESISGTTGKSLRLEGIRIKISDSPNLGVSYQTHVQNVGWQD